MAFDPSQLIVGSAGFAYDWLITREWKRILVAAIPLYVAAAVFGLAFWSSLSNKSELARWYLELGNEEIAEWEDAVAPTDIDSDEDGSGTPEGGSEVAADANGTSDTLDEPKISPFAETLFRRVQMLRPGDRSQFFVATSLLQQGAIGQAEQLLVGIAPNEGSAGYAPAHYQLANIYRGREREDEAKYRPLRMHHLAQATRWNRLPISSLVEAAEVYANSGKLMQAANFQSIAAERDPAMNVELARLARAMENPKLAERASRTAEEHLTAKVEEDPSDLRARSQLARLYIGLNKFANAEAALFSGVTGDITPRFKREQSDFLIVKFQRSVKLRNGKVDFSIGVLEQALKVDPTNPNVANEVARMVRMANATPTDELLDSLRSMLASGQATSTTHSLLAATYLDRGDMKSAIKHLEQVKMLAPKQTQNLNNLAFCLSEVYPERIDEAIELSNRAIELAKDEPKTPLIQMAEYYDTNALVLSKADKIAGAVSAIESAITTINVALANNARLEKQLDQRLLSEGDDDKVANLKSLLAQVPRARVGLLSSKAKYHKTAAGLYRKQSDEGMAKAHEQFHEAALSKAEETKAQAS
ncbi:MAG: hypothetical protein Aurels2KO_42590 [Aureliella sp.]